MSIQDWGAVGEIVGAIAVVVTLLYLAGQIRQNTQVARSAARQAITQGATDFARNLTESGELTDLLHRSLDGQALEPNEMLRVQAFFYMTMRQYENIHYQHLSGMLDEADWSGFRENLKGLFGTTLYYDYWGMEHQFYNPTFQGLVKQIISELQVEHGVTSEVTPEVDRFPKYS